MTKAQKADALARAERDEALAKLATAEQVAKDWKTAQQVWEALANKNGEERDEARRVRDEYKANHDRMAGLLADVQQERDKHAQVRQDQREAMQLLRHELTNANDAADKWSMVAATARAEVDRLAARNAELVAEAQTAKAQTTRIEAVFTRVWEIVTKWRTDRVPMTSGEAMRLIAGVMEIRGAEAAGKQTAPVPQVDSDGKSVGCDMPHPSDMRHPAPGEITNANHADCDHDVIAVKEDHERPVYCTCCKIHGGQAK